MNSDIIASAFMNAAQDINMKTKKNTDYTSNVGITGSKLNRIREKSRVCIVLHDKHNNEDSILMVNGPSFSRKSNGKTDVINLYGLPGGSREFGETSCETAARELIEETGGLLKQEGGKIFLVSHPNDCAMDDVVRNSAKVIEKNAFRAEKFNKYNRNNEFYYFIRPDDISGFYPNPGTSGEINYVSFMRVADVINIDTVKYCDKDMICEYFNNVSGSRG